MPIAHKKAHRPFSWRKAVSKAPTAFPDNIYTHNASQGFFCFPWLYLSSGLQFAAFYALSYP